MKTIALVLCFVLCFNGPRTAKAEELGSSPEAVAETKAQRISPECERMIRELEGRRSNSGSGPIYGGGWGHGAGSSDEVLAFVLVFLIVIVVIALIVEAHHEQQLKDLRESCRATQETNPGLP